MWCLERLARAEGFGELGLSLVLEILGVDRAVMNLVLKLN